ncbi:MAG: CBS domain-containing protein [Actinobacteria bacterium]|nr:CBS domain-containing protein [Actinomycetota bacterium]MBU1942738.1 CBS domain-containing protein [Actinomycetota bacterium]MBU2686060.1 CBS domain-containing protein [Actinomycetota bacterium]
MKEVLVEQAMTPDPITIHPEMEVADIAKLMIEKNIGGVPVVDHAGNLIGIVTESDLVVQDSEIGFPSFVTFLSGYVFVPGSLHHFEDELRKATAATARQIMTKDVVTVEVDDTAEHVATLMSRKKMKRFPVLSKGRLVGMITMADIVRLIARDVPVEGTE